MQIQRFEALNQQYSMPKTQSARFSGGQKANLEEILSRYNSENFSNSSRTSFKEELQSSQIPLEDKSFQVMQQAAFTKSASVALADSGTPALSDKLDEQQKADLQEILSQYNPEELSDSDKISLREDLQTAQMPLGRETFQIMHDAGFGRPDGVTRLGTDETTTQSDKLGEQQKAELQEILSHYDPEALSEADKNSLTEELQTAQIPLGRETFQIMHDAGYTRPAEVTDTETEASTDSVKLNEQQKADLKEILSHYNPEALSEADKNSLTEELQTAQIPLGRETFQIMHDAGYARPAEVADTETDTPIQSATLDEQQKADLQEILSQYNPEELSDSDKVSLRHDLQSAQMPLGKETFEIMQEAGFTKPDGATPMSGATAGWTTSKTAGVDISPVRDLLQQLSAGEITGDEFATQFDQLRQQLPSTSGTLLNTTT